MQEATTAAAAVVVGLIGCHVYEVFRTNNLFHHVAQIIGYGVAKGFSNQLARVLDGELDFQVLVPVRVYRQFSFPYPFCVVLNDAGDLEVMFNVEFFQSGPDCK